MWQRTVLTVFLACALLAVPAAQAATRLAVFGDTGVTPNTQRTVDGSLADGATGYIGLGDMYYWDSPSAWRSMFEPLTRSGAYLVRGNHDDPNALPGLFPSGTTWSRAVAGARIVGLDTERNIAVGSQQYQFARDSLCGASESERILVLHRNWWMGAGAKHTAAEFPGDPAAMDNLVKDCGVDLVLAAHEHNYQRMVRNGVNHVLVGTGGMSLNAVGGSPSGTVASHVGYGRLILDVSSTGYQAVFRANDLSYSDTFSHGDPKGAPLPTTPAISFTPRGGNEWWVQVGIGGHEKAKVTKVEAKPSGGAWSPLAKKEWGDWAASIRIPPGSLVTYRATLQDGRTFTSCDYAHPGGTCATAPPPSGGGGTPGLTFSGSGGNEWWAQVRVGGSDAAHVRSVEAMDPGGPWIALTLRDWGSWAASFHIQPGHTVTYRATLHDGRTITSCTYTHPGGTCTTSTPDSGSFTVTFRNVRGNTWWIETDVTSGNTITKVETKIGQGNWITLDKKSWGSWATSAHAPHGSTVTLRATSADGKTATSSAYAWPP